MPIFEISSQDGCLFLRGAYFHGVLINGCNFLAVYSCVDRLAVIYLGTFNFCSMFIAYLQPEIQSAIDQSIVANLPLANIKRLEPTIP